MQRVLTWTTASSNQTPTPTLSLTQAQSHSPVRANPSSRRHVAGSHLEVSWSMVIDGMQRCRIFDLLSGDPTDTPSSSMGLSVVG